MDGSGGVLEEILVKNLAWERICVPPLSSDIGKRR